MSILVSDIDGGVSASGTWLLANHIDFPTNYSANSYVDVTTAGYTAYFTPTTAADACQGIIVYNYMAYQWTVGNTSTMRCDLMEGAVIRASAYMNFAAAHDHGTTGGFSGWLYFKFATPYVYGNTDAGTWRFKFSRSAGAKNFYFRNATSGASNVAYGEVVTVQQAPVNNDTLIICGAGTVAGTLTPTTVTVDESITLGTTASLQYEAIGIGKGGTLTWGAAQTASYTITCDNNIRVLASDDNAFGFEMGTAANPLTEDYTQTLLFNSTAANKYGLWGQEGSNESYMRNWTPSRVSIYGNYLFNQAGNDSYQTTLAAQATAGTATLVLTDDTGYRAAGGDVLYVSSTNGALQCEQVTAQSYVAATKTVTLTGNLAYTHAIGAYVWLLSANAVIKSSNALYYVQIWTFGYPGISTLTYPHVEISNLETQYLAWLYLNACDPTSIMQYIRCRNRTGQDRAPVNGNSTVELYRSIFDVGVYPGLSTYGSPRCHYTECVFVSRVATTYGLQVIAGSSIITDCLFESSSIWYTSFGNNQVIRCKQWGNNSYGSYIQNDSFNNYFESCSWGSPVVNVTADYAHDASVHQGTFISPLFYSATKIDPTVMDDGYADCETRVQAYQGDGTDNRLYKSEGLIQTCGAGLSDTTTRTTGEPALRFAQWTAHPNSEDSLNVTISKGVAANSTVVWYGYMRKNSDYGGLYLPNVLLESLDGYIYEASTISDVVDTWKFFSCAGQVGPADTYIEMTMDVPCTSGIAYFGDMQLVIGNPTTGTASGYKVGTLWKEGLPTADEALGGTVDPVFLENSVWDAAMSGHLTTGTAGETLHLAHIAADDAAALIMAK
jgi:hypothetical protein